MRKFTLSSALILLGCGAETRTPAITATATSESDRSADGPTSFIPPPPGPIRSTLNGARHVSSRIEDWPMSALAMPGMKVEDAEELAREKGLEVRAVRVNGEDVLRATDAVPNRVNVEVENGVVVKVVSVG